MTTDPPRNNQPDSSGEADKLAAIIQLRLGWTGFARPPVGDSTSANTRYVAMLCLEAGETPKLKLLNARCFLSASAHECLVEDPVLSIPPDPARSPLLTVLICRVLPSNPGRLRPPRLTNFASLLTITYHERPWFPQRISRWWLIIEFFRRPSSKGKPYRVGLYHSTNRKRPFNHDPINIITFVNGDAQ